MKAFVIKVLLITTWLHFSASVALSQPQIDSSIPAGLCFVAESIELTFKPTKSRVYIETGFRDVQAYPAETFVVEERANRCDVVSGAVVDWNRFDMNGKSFSVAFVFEDDAGNFSSFPVKSVSNDDCLKKTVGTDSSRGQGEDLRQQVQSSEQSILLLERRGKDLRDKVSLIAEVDKIIQVRSEIAAAKARVSDLSIDKQRLQRLIAQSKTMPELEDVDILRRELSMHLQEAAKATATADRLNKRKKDVAMHEIQNNVALIKETNIDNPQDLARTALELRAERKRLEMRLGARPTESQNEF